MARGPCPRGHQLGTPLLTLLTFSRARLSAPICVSGISLAGSRGTHNPCWALPSAPTRIPMAAVTGRVPTTLGRDLHPGLWLLLPVEVPVVALVPGTRLCRGDGQCGHGHREAGGRMGAERCFWKDFPREGPADLEATGLREQRTWLWIVGGVGYGQQGLRIWGKLGATWPLPGVHGFLEGVEVGGPHPCPGCAPLGSAGRPSIEGCGLPATASDGTLALPLDKAPSLPEPQSLHL